MNVRMLTLAATVLVGLHVPSVATGQIYSITYTDLTFGTTTDLTAVGTLDWVKWGNGQANPDPYTSPQNITGTIINPMLTPLGTAPPDASVVLVPFAPPPMTTILDFTWTDGTEEMAGGGPVGTVVSETITPAQYSYPLGLGASFQAEADAAPRLLDVYVQGFNTQMRLTATLSGGDSDTLLASDAAVTLVPDANNNYFSAGIFSILYAGDGETLTVDLTADNQDGIPTDAPQYVFPNAGVFAATVVPGDG
jgi:hypothetical protein